MSVVRTIARQITLFSLVLVFLVLLAAETQAGMYEFDLWKPITSNSGYEDEFAEGLLLTVTDEGVGAGKVLFTFYNNSTIDPKLDSAGNPTVGPGAITDIYFDDGALLGISSIINSTGVSFGYPAAPGNLPGGNTVYPAFETSSVESPVMTPHFSADSRNAPLGADPGEHVGILFDLEGSNTLGNVIDAINVGFDPAEYYDGGAAYDDNDGWTRPSLRIGIHVSNLGLDKNSDDDPGDYSDSFIMTPVPGAFLLGILGLGVAGVKMRRFA